MVTVCKTGVEGHRETIELVEKLGDGDLFE